MGLAGVGVGVGVVGAGVGVGVAVVPGFVGATVGAVGLGAGVGGVVVGLGLATIFSRADNSPNLKEIASALAATIEASNFVEFLTRQIPLRVFDA